MEETAKCRTHKIIVQALKRTLPGAENPLESPSEIIFLKNFKNISENFAKTAPSIRDRSERGRKPTSRCMRGGEQLLELTPSQKKTVRHQFDSFCRKVRREEARDYERYIAALATRTLYDENGVPHLCLDEEKVCRMRTKLITKILDFKVNKTA